MAADLLDLLGGDPALARGKADVMDRRARAQQDAGLILRTLAGDRDPTGGALVQGGQHEMDKLGQAIEARPTYQLQDVKARQAQAEEQAWQDPAAQRVLRGAIGAFMPNMPVDENTPTQVLRNILPTAEKFGQSYNALSLRQALHGFQQKTDPGTGETYMLDPVSGATFRQDGSQRTRPLRGPLLSPGRPPASAPAGAPLAAPAPGAPAVADGVPAAAPAPPKKNLLVQPGGAPAPGATQFPQLFGKVRQKALDSLVNDFDPNHGGGDFAKNQARVNAAHRVMALAENPDGTPANLTPNQMPELAQSVVGLINSGSSGAQAQIEHMLPKSYSRDVAGVLQYLTSEPQGAGQQAFVKQFLETAKREQGVAQQAIEKARDQRWAKHQPFIRGNPDEARQALQGFGWDIGPDGKPVLQAPKAEAAAASPADQQAKAWAAANPGDPRAAKILERLKAKGM